MHASIDTGNIPNHNAAIRQLDYRALLGETAWSSLPQDTRRRFMTHCADYTGTMTLKASLCGWLLAWLLGPFGSPLPIARDVTVPARVSVSPDLRTGGSRWVRCYELERKRSCTISSTKALDGAGRLVERLGFGLRMHLQLSAQDGALYFRSNAYSIECLGRNLRLPAWWPPGRTEVIHRDLGNGRFRFTMDIEHPWLGKLFHHDGSFAMTGDKA